MGLDSCYKWNSFYQGPFAPLLDDGEKGMTVAELFKKKIFWILMLMMLCAGASEQAVSQWASTLAEKSFGINKTIGDLAGPMAFCNSHGKLQGILRKIRR